MTEWADDPGRHGWVRLSCKRGHRWTSRYFTQYGATDLETPACQDCGRLGSLDGEVKRD